MVKVEKTPTREVFYHKACMPKGIEQRLPVTEVTWRDADDANDIPRPLTCAKCGGRYRLLELIVDYSEPEEVNGTLYSNALWGWRLEPIKKNVVYTSSSKPQNPHTWEAEEKRNHLREQGVCI
jgi:hypothetical protein